jgi:hypothetical protein
MNSNLETMTKSELKAYLLQYRDDLEAFRYLMDKINSEPDQDFYSPDEASNLSEFLSDRNYGKSVT